MWRSRALGFLQETQAQAGRASTQTLTLTILSPAEAQVIAAASHSLPRHPGLQNSRAAWREAGATSGQELPVGEGPWARLGLGLASETSRYGSLLLRGMELWVLESPGKRAAAKPAKASCTETILQAVHWLPAPGSVRLGCGGILE